jgi:hypothetical protein
MESATRIYQPSPAGVGACELDGRFNALASGTAEERLLKAATRKSAETLAQFSGQFGNMALQHARTAAIQLLLQRGDDGRVIMARVVYAVPGEKIEDAPAVLGLQFGASATLVANVHPQYIEESNPLRIHIFPIQILMQLTRRTEFFFKWHHLSDYIPGLPRPQCEATQGGHRFEGL